jgi:predicted RNase H-like HicB family nuclease
MPPSIAGQPDSAAPSPPAAELHDLPVVVVVNVPVQALAFPEADGGYSVVVPELPGCFTEADSIEEVRANVAEAARGWLAVQHDRNRVAAIRDAMGEGEHQP